MRTGKSPSHYRRGYFQREIEFPEAHARPLVSLRGIVGYCFNVFDSNIDARRAVRDHQTDRNTTRRWNLAKRPTYNVILRSWLIPRTSLVVFRSNEPPRNYIHIYIYTLYTLTDLNTRCIYI